MKSPKNKGSAGERELAKWLQRTLNLDEAPKRNLEQTRSGGADLILPPFMFEVKRCERLDLDSWWVQITKATGNESIRVVAFRQNHRPWEFLISANYVGIEKGYVRLNETVFKKWIKNKFNYFII